MRASYSPFDGPGYVHNPLVNVSSVPLVSNEDHMPYTGSSSDEEENRVATWEELADPGRNPSASAAEASGCFMCVYFLCVLAMGIATVLVFGRRWGKCDQPLQLWSVTHVSRHFIKWVLYMDRARLLRTSASVPDSLRYQIKVLESVALVWWVFGLFWMTNCRECEEPVYRLAMVLFAVQTAFLVLPCIVLLLVLMCLPLLVWVVPYVIPVNPNQTGTPSDVLARARTGTIAALHEFSDVDALKECSICLCHMEDDQIAMQLPCHVHHIFHTRCIERWLQNSQLCPICRSNVAHLLSPETAPQTESGAAAGLPLLADGANPGASPERGLELVEVRSAGADEPS